MRLQETTFRSGRLTLETNGANIPSVGALLSDERKTQRLGRAALVHLPLPETTDTFQPIPHYKMIEALEEALNYRHIKVVKEEFAVSLDGMKLFGLLELNALYEGIRFAVGIRNANDKSMRLGMVAGYRVTVCDNMMFAGEFKPLLAKHSKNFDLIDSVSLGVDRIQRGFQPLREAVTYKRAAALSDNEAKILIYQAFMAEKFPITLIKAVHQNYFEPPHPEFRGRNLWSLENAFTESFKELLPIRQYEITAKLGKFVQKTMDTNKRLAEEEENRFADFFNASLRDENESEILALPAWTGGELC